MSPASFFVWIYGVRDGCLDFFGPGGIFPLDIPHMAFASYDIAKVGGGKLSVKGSS